MHRISSTLVTFISIGLASASCSQATKYGDYMPFKEMRAAQAAETTDSPLMGHVDTSFAPVSGRETALPWKDGQDINYVRTGDGRICFHRTRSNEWKSDRIQPDEQKVREAVKSNKYLFEHSQTFVIQARKTLDDVTEKTLWPEKVPSDIDEAKVSVVSDKMVDNALHMHNTPGERVELDIELCGKAPTLDASVRFLTLTVLESSIQDAPGLYIWVVDGAGGATDPGGTTAAETSGSGAATPVAPIGAAISGNLIEVMTAAGNYSTFLKLVEADGMTDQLKGGGPFTVFAPTDRAIATLRHDAVARVINDKKALDEFVRGHIATKAYGRDLLESAGSTDVTMMDSTVKVRFKSGHLKVGTSTLTSDQGATNGVLWAMDVP
jgi:uncharacterized surface protein with fasciclin (FAS1) repeats